MDFKNHLKEYGFSLLEILVALAIMGFLSVSLYTITNNNIETKDIVIKEDQDFLQVYTAMHRFDSDFSQIYSPLYFSSLSLGKTRNASNANFNEQNNNSSQNEEISQYTFKTNQLFPKATVNNDPVPAITQEDKNSLRFMTSSHRRFFYDQKQSHYAWVEYYLEEDDRLDKATGPYQLMRKIINNNIYDKDLDFKAVRGFPILKGVESFDIEFYSLLKEDWVESISLLAPKERYTPRALRITIVYRDKNKTKKVTTRVFRPYWPYFDVIADETIRQSNKNSLRGKQKNEVQ